MNWQVWEIGFNIQDGEKIKVPFLKEKLRTFWNKNKFMFASRKKTKNIFEAFL